MLVTTCTLFCFYFINSQLNTFDDSYISVHFLVDLSLAYPQGSATHTTNATTTQGVLNYAKLD